MSAIDQYKHKLIGFIACRSTYNFVYMNDTRKIAIYELHESVPSDEDNFDGNTGDIICGGGSGEAPAFRIAYPKAFEFFTSDSLPDFENYDELFKAFWTPTESYILCEGFLKLGWRTNISIELWLAENICQVLINSLNKYSRFKSDDELTKTSLSFENTFET
jgi:hypothetical protein